MHGRPGFIEDLPQLAAEASEVATRLCGSCQNYHFLWPYLRLAGAPGGAEDGEPYLNSAIAQTMAGGRRRLLIAGAADTGLLALVARASAGRDAEIVVLDRCETPLELCRSFAARHDLQIETIRADLEELSAQAEFDIILAHTTLTVIPAGRRPDVMSRMRRALRANGRLIIRFRTRTGAPSADTSTYQVAVLGHLVERLDRMQIALPEPRDAFRRRVEAYASARHGREATDGDYADVERLFEAAGLTIEQATLTEPARKSPFENPTVDIHKFVAILKPAPQT